jgi:hypothetical protein
MNWNALIKSILIVVCVIGIIFGIFWYPMFMAKLLVGVVIVGITIVIYKSLTGEDKIQDEDDDKVF